MGIVMKKGLRNYFLLLISIKDNANLLFNPLLPQWFFFVVFLFCFLNSFFRRHSLRISSYRLPTHSRDDHRNFFFIIPSEIEIKIFG